MAAARATARRLVFGPVGAGWVHGRLGLVRNALRGFIRAVPRVPGILWLALLELLTPCVVVLLAPLFYWRILTPNRLDVATFPIGDFTDLNYPFRRWVAQQLALGEEPFWNPYMSAGHSAIGDIQFRALYLPDTLVAQYSDGAFSVRLLEMDIIGHVAMGSLFTYLLARRLTRSRIGGLVSAIVFGFGGYLSGFPIQQANLLDASVWLPLILLCIDIGADFNLVTAFVAGAVALSFSALAGHPQTLFYVGLASGLYLIFKGWNRGQVRLAALPGLPVHFVGGIALAASALVPAYFHLGQTDRTDVSYAFSSTGFALHEALGLVLPVGFGGTPLYNGIFTLLLVAVGLGSSTRRTNKVFWAGLAVLSLMLSFGGNTFLQPISYLLLGSLKFRQYERSVFLVDLAIAVLAGYGAAELTSARDLRLGWLRRGALWAIAAVLGFSLFAAVQYAGASGDAQPRLLALLDRALFTAIVLGVGAAILFTRERRALRPTVAGLLAALLVGLDLFSTNWQNNLRPGDPEQISAPSPIAEYLESYTTGLYRVASEGLLPGDGNAGSLYHLQDVVGNTPLETRDYAEFTQKVPEVARWQILGVRYVVTQRKIDDPRLHLLRQDGPRNLYELDEKVRLPRAYVVNQTIYAPDHQIALELLKDADLRRTAIVEGAGPVLDGKPDDHSKVQITAYDADGLSLKASLAAPGLLVIGDVDYPGWQAEVDGRPSPIVRTDGIVRGVPLPPGEHVVSMQFVPPGLADGRRLSARAQTLLLYVVEAEIALRVAWAAWRLALRIPWKRIRVLRRRHAA